MIYTLFLIFYLFHQYCVYGENRFKAILQKNEERYISYLDIINQKFEEGNSKYFYSFEDSEYKCELKNIYVILQNSSPKLNNLFTKNNEDALKEGIDKLKERFFIIIDRISPPAMSLKGMVENPQKLAEAYFINFRRQFFLNESDSLLVPGENHISNESLLSYLRGSDFGASIPESEDQGNSDLSQTPNAVSAENNEEKETLKVYPSYSSKKIKICSYKENCDNTSHDVTVNGIISPENALEVLLDTISLKIEGVCSVKKGNINVEFVGSTSRSSFSVKTYLYDGSGKGNANEIDFLDNKTKINEMIRLVNEFIHKFYVHSPNHGFGVFNSSIESLSTLDHSVNKVSDNVNSSTQDNVEGGNQ